MQQIRFFKSTENDLTSLQSEMNAWLKANPVRVVQIFGNIAPQTVSGEEAGTGLTKSAFAPSDVLVAVLYEYEEGAERGEEE